MCEKIPGGREWRQWIREYIGKSKLLVFLYTTGAAEWGWCLFELGLFQGGATDRSVVCVKNACLLGPTAWQSGSAPREVEAVREGERDATVLPMDLAEIYGLVTHGHYEFSAHAQRERLADDLDVIEIEQALLNGEILEQYPSDPRGKSCLVLGFCGARPIHVVLGWASRVDPERTTLRVIIVYVPQPPKWSDARTRGGMQ